MSLMSNGFCARAWQIAVQLADSIAPAQGARSAAEHLDLGSWGEEAAFFYLRRNGFVVVAQQWTSAKAPGDLDVIAWEGDVLCFVEVKTRSSRAIASAESAVDRWKRRTLRRLARHYLRQLPADTPTRFDVLSIYRNLAEPAQSAKYELFRHAFGWEEGLG